ncbi:MAG TPA: hypothetical protein DEA27_00425 [Candidatus Moranbacteria bacterium]|nr:hypothetical protein [Candidatus Moranbacteria bacterium]
MIGQFADIPKGIAKGFQEVKDGNDGAEYDYYREGGISQAKYRNYSDDPQGALPSSGSPGYPPVNFGRDCTSAIIVPGSNIVLPVPGTTRSGRAFYAPNSGNLQANIGSRGWNVRLGN